jgi:uncharacterized membrane protein YagU involved in acid resistance
MRAKGVVPAILAGGLVGAACDLAVACALSGLPLMTVGKAVARGWFGKARAMAGGTDVALIGLASHFAIVLAFAAAFVLASRHAPILRRLWFVTGPLYGAVIFGVMRFLVLPLSAAGYSMPPPPALWFEVAGHLFLVGLPIAFAAQALVKTAGEARL